MIAIITVKLVFFGVFLSIGELNVAYIIYEYIFTFLLGKSTVCCSNSFFFVLNKNKKPHAQAKKRKTT